MIFPFKTSRDGQVTLKPKPEKHWYRKDGLVFEMFTHKVPGISDQSPISSFVSYTSALFKESIFYGPQNFEDSTRRKYWNRSHFLFSKVLEGTQLDDDSFWALTPEVFADHVSERIRQAFPPTQKWRVLDLGAGCGGNTISLAKSLPPSYFEVYGLDKCAEKLKKCRQNAEVYGVSHLVNLIHSTSDELGETYDIVHISPPWGGPDHLHLPSYSLCLADVFESRRKDQQLDYTTYEWKARQSDKDIEECKRLRANGVASHTLDMLHHGFRASTNTVILYLPRNTSIEELVGFATEYGYACIEVERLHVVTAFGSTPQLKVMVVYFSKLVCATSIGYQLSEVLDERDRESLSALTFKHTPLASSPRVSLASLYEEEDPIVSISEAAPIFRGVLSEFPIFRRARMIHTLDHHKKAELTRETLAYLSEILGGKEFIPYDAKVNFRMFNEAARKALTIT